MELLTFALACGALICVSRTIGAFLRHYAAGAPS